MLQPEQILQNRYQIKQKLGENAARQTWLATDLEASEVENSQVVVKLLAFGGQVQWENLKLFEREAQVLKQLNHPHIPKYRDYFSIDDCLLWFALVEEYIPGSSFKDLLTQGKKFTEQQVHKIAVNVLNILVYLHELNPPVLHRDIKPSNLILGEDEEVYLVDFGAVQDKAAKEGGTFTVVGTYGYTPIEQFGGRAVPASDLYALGATLIHLLTGTAPADLPQRDLRIQFSDKVNVSSSLVSWIEQLIEPALERRFSTAHKALQALQTGRSSNTPLPILRQPRNSRVQLNKSSSQLEIKILAQGLHGIQDREGCSMLFWLAFWLFWGFYIFRFSLLLQLLVCGSSLLSSLLLPIFGQTYVYFDREHFAIKWKIFGFCYRKECSRTSEIEYVFEGIDEKQNNRVTFMDSIRHYIFSQQIGIPDKGVILLLDSQQYTFGAFTPSLSEIERRWLIQEIKDWLNLK